MDDTAIMKKTIWVASTNQAKIDGTRMAFEQLYAGTTFDTVGKKIQETPGGKLAHGPLLEQPLTDEETRRCAVARLAYLMDLELGNNEKPDFYVAIECGVAPHENSFIVLSWAVVADCNGRMGTGRSASFVLPLRIAAEIKKGHTMLAGCKIVCSPESNPNGKDGLVSILSDGAINRSMLSAQAVTMALLALKNGTLYAGHMKQNTN